MAKINNFKDTEGILGNRLYTTAISPASDVLAWERVA